MTGVVYPLTEKEMAYILDALGGIINPMVVYSRDQATMDQQAIEQNQVAATTIRDLLYDKWPSLKEAQP